MSLIDNIQNKIIGPGSILEPAEETAEESVSETRRKAEEWRRVLAARERRLKELEKQIEQKEERVRELERLIAGQQLTKKQARELSNTQLREMSRLLDERLDNLGSSLRQHFDETDEAESIRYAEFAEQIEQLKKSQEEGRRELAERTHEESVQSFQNVKELIKGTDAKLYDMDLSQKSLKAIRKQNGFWKLLILLMLADLVVLTLLQFGVLPL